MKYLILDTESTGAQRPSKGSALDPRNRLCYIGISSSGDPFCFPIEYEVERPYGKALDTVNGGVGDCHLLVLFNAKHDLHWIRRYGIHYTGPVWDCQLAEFIIEGQTSPFPDLDSTSQKYGSPGKNKQIEENYYNKGKDTDEIPEQELVDYLQQDIRCTEKVFLGQVEHLKDKPALKRLIWEACQDLLVTEEMEWNGLKWDMTALRCKAESLEVHIIEIEKALHKLVSDPRINWESPAQVSAILYGGDISFDAQETYQFIYKDPKKPPRTKTRWVEQTITFPRLVEPIARSELSSGGFSTTDKVLRKLKTSPTAKRIIDLILDRRGTQTQISRYFRGLPKKYAEMGWTDSLTHGQFHHVVAATGRLSSSDPNQQNIDERARTCLQTRFQTLPESSPQLLKNTELPTL